MPSLRKYLLGAILAFFVGGFVIHALTAKLIAPAATFTTLSGEKISLADQKGKVVLVNFWATTCSICAHEMPGLVDAYNAYKDKGLVVVAVAMPYDPPNYVLSYTQDRKLPFPVALDVMGEAMRAFGGVRGTPTTFLIGKDGTIVEQRTGELDFTRLDAYLRKELG
ncbi:MAG TPA: TlpA disulfide reductase family protein [Thiobacillaceae bacterium]|nr:TlpA disulfide reductase family protein [Thiobacillaceae bacterium]